VWGRSLPVNKLENPGKNGLKIGKARECGMGETGVAMSKSSLPCLCNLSVSHSTCLSNRHRPSSAKNGSLVYQLAPSHNAGGDIRMLIYFTDLEPHLKHQDGSVITVTGYGTGYHRTI